SRRERGPVGKAGLFDLAALPSRRLRCSDVRRLVIVNGRCIAAALGLLLAGAAACDRSEPLPVLGTLPSFELVDQRGEAFRSEEMRGEVWIANFVFTRCPSICPTLSRRMAELQHRYLGRKDELRLLSVTVDPANDS